MVPQATYKKFFTELIRKHMAILGPNIARDTAMRVNGLILDSSGDVTEIAGDSTLVMQELVDSYTELSAPVTQLSLYTLFETYPTIKQEYNQPLGKIKLVCSLTERKA
jgi:hypothetical protein